MGASRLISSALSGGLGGAGAGGGIAGGLGMAGVAAAGPLAPWLIGGGAALGLVGSIFGSNADEDTPEAKAERRRARGLSMFRKNMGRAFKGVSPQTFGGMINGTP